MPATVDPIGEVIIGGVQLTTDPQKYKPPRTVTPKRSTYLPGIQATGTVQEFAGHVLDHPVTLGGSGGQGLTQECKVALEAFAATLGEPLQYSDWLGSNVLVTVEDFEA